MKKRLWKTIFAILFLLPVCANATDKTFTTSGTIVDGNVYGSVYVQNDGTIVDMSGGQITNWLGTRDTSIFNMSGGLISGFINIDYLSSFNVSGGTITVSSDFVVYGSANISGGNITAGRLKTYPAAFNPVTPASVVDINGGSLNFNIFDIHGEVNIYRGLLDVNDSWIGGWGNDQASINVYGHDFNYDSYTRILTGHLLDNNPFIIKGVDASEYTRFNLIPEPISLLLFGFGLLAVRLQRIN